MRKKNVFDQQLMWILMRLGRPSQRALENGTRADLYFFKTPTSCCKIKVPTLTTACLFGFSKEQTKNHFAQANQLVCTCFRFLSLSEPVVPDPDS